MVKVQFQEKLQIINILYSLNSPQAIVEGRKVPLLNFFQRNFHFYSRKFQTFHLMIALFTSLFNILSFKCYRNCF